MIVIIGGGISGLSVAFFLQKAGKAFVLFEKDAKPGGVMKSVKMDNTLLELGPNSILVDEDMKELISALDLGGDIEKTEAVNKDRYILKNGKYLKLPSHPLEILFGNFFSTKTKIKILSEFFRKKGRSSAITLEDFFLTHFGKEIVEYALNPFISGIYAGDPKALLVDETFPSLRKYEEESGSVLKGIIKNVGARKETVNFKEGIQMLPVAMAEGLNIKYNTSVSSVRKNSSGFEIEYSEGGVIKKIDAEKVVFSIPSYEMSRVVSEFSDLSDALKRIYYPPMCIVHTVYEKAAIKNSLEGFGGLNPKIEGRISAGSIWTSSIFPRRSSEKEFLFTTFVGGVQYKEYALLGEEEVKDKVHQELSELFQITGKPLFQNYTYWSKAIPQYDVNILAAKECAKKYENENLYVSSNIFGGISMPDCVRKGKALAERLSKN